MNYIPIDFLKYRAKKEERYFEDEKEQKEILVFDENYLSHIEDWLQDYQVDTLTKWYTLHASGVFSTYDLLSRLHGARALMLDEEIAEELKLLTDLAEWRYYHEFCTEK